MRGAGVENCCMKPWSDETNAILSRSAPFVCVSCVAHVLYYAELWLFQNLHFVLKFVFLMYSRISCVLGCLYWACLVLLVLVLDKFLFQNFFVWFHWTCTKLVLVVVLVVFY
ncbi:hypothetical protein VPH35_099510 [Triticum aestivum]|uniref:Uncharacterized protein n=1 Tax=Aegilops tauschii subsp. strangulata TaxID=200361 RepID=A0A453LLF7_AEGTS